MTICTQNKKSLFGEVPDEKMQLNEIGEIIRSEWHGLQKQFPGMELDEFAIMPNHVHGILIFQSTEIGAETGAINRAPTLGMVIRYWKARTTFLTRKKYPGILIWQRNYYEHIIRNESDLEIIRDYIRNNPLKWALDPENPERGERAR